MIADAPQRKKFSGEVLVYQFAFGRESFIASDVIASAVVAADASGITLGTPSVDSGGLSVSVQISSGTSGTNYGITLTATTTSSKVVVGAVNILIR